MKVCIIAFDSLDYYLIRDLNLANLKQKEFGIVKVTGILSTPSIWTSFITGLSPNEHGVIGWKWDNSILDKIKVFGTKIGLDKIIHNSLYLTKLMSNVTTKQTPNIKGKIPTIFDYAQNPVDIDVPCYSEDAYKDIRQKVTMSLGNPILAKNVIEEESEKFVNKIERIFNLLNTNWDLFMAHIYYPDVLQHLQFYNKNSVIEMYKKMDDTAYQIKKTINKDTFILFISDHGQNKGIHNKNAFYSCNYELDLQQPKITDFFDIILNKMGIPSKEDFEKIQKKLKDWGYI